MVASETTVAGQMNCETVVRGRSLTRLLTFTSVVSNSLNHQVGGVTRNIRQSPDITGGVRANNEELGVDPGDW